MLLVSRTRHAVSEVSAHDLTTGELTARLSCRGSATVGGIGERPEGGHEAWFGYTDYTTPPVVLRYDATAGTLDTWAAAPGAGALTDGRAAGGHRVAGDVSLDGRHRGPDGDH